MVSNEPARGIIAESHVRLEIHSIWFIMQIYFNEQIISERKDYTEGNGLCIAKNGSKFITYIYTDIHSRQKLRGHSD